MSRSTRGTGRSARRRSPAIRVSLPSDRSFVTFESALARRDRSAAATDTTLVWNQALLDVLLRVSDPVRSLDVLDPAGARRASACASSRSLRFLPPAGAERAFELTGDPGLVRLDPSWHQAARRFVQLGFVHILDGTDHLLFLLCLVIPFRRFRPLVAIVTAFTVAHSITLIASAFGLAPGRRCGSRR